MRHELLEEQVGPLLFLACGQPNLIGTPYQF